jgi:hypothetical protein
MGAALITLSVSRLARFLKFGFPIHRSFPLKSCRQPSLNLGTGVRVAVSKSLARSGLSKSRKTAIAHALLNCLNRHFGRRSTPRRLFPSQLSHDVAPGCTTLRASRTSSLIASDRGGIFGCDLRQSSTN